MTTPLYISDLDGTLLQSDASLSPKSLQGLNELLQRPDFNFTIATARGYYSTHQKLAGLQLRLPIILSNGACITDLKTGKHLVVNSIPAELIPAIYQSIRLHDCYPMISSNDGQRDNLYCHIEINDGIHWFHQECAQVKDSRLRAAQFYEKGLVECITSLVVIDNLQKIKELYTDLQQQFQNQLSIHYYENIYSKGWYWLEISSLTANKGSAIQQLCELCSLDKNNVTAFGDNHNDAPMLEVAQHKIVVDNAPIALKEMATEVIGRNEEDAVLGYLWGKN